MCAEPLRILLVGRDLTPESQFSERLCRSGCLCAIARSVAEARAVLDAQQFDLVLSEMALPDGTAYPLLGLLERTPATLFFRFGVRDGCWWLPALERGRRTWGQAALRPPEFAHQLDALLAAAPPLPATKSASPAAPDRAKIIPMPAVEFVTPKPQRVQPAKVKVRKASA
jgi:CheY-like chemotaxis protein